MASIYGLRSTRAASELPSPLVDDIRIFRLETPLPGRAKDGRFWAGECRGPWVYRLTDAANLPMQSLAALEWDLVATMAGSIAEAMYCWYRGADKIEDFARDGAGGGADFRRVDLLMAELCRMTKRRRVQKPYVRRTIAFLKAHWDEVEALAHILIAEKKIEGDRIAEIVDAAACPVGDVALKDRARRIRAIHGDLNDD